MPLIGIPLARLLASIGKALSREELQAALESLGCDVEGFSVASRYSCDNCGHLTDILDSEPAAGMCPNCSGSTLSHQGTVEVVRINLLPVRPDLFDAHGLARALRGLLGLETGLADYTFKASGYTCMVERDVQEIRPWIACCVARGVTLDGDTLRGLMKLQENLHWALGRDRRRASIGIYDLDTLQPDFHYCSILPEEVEFVPLATSGSTMTPRRILEQHPKGIAYAHLLRGFERYPLLRDSTGRILSMPPIINSDDTKVTPQTRNLLVDVTGPDRAAVHRTLAVIASSLSDAGADVQTVRIVYPGHQEETPTMTPSRMILSVAYTWQLLGVKPEPDAILESLKRMRFEAQPASPGSLEKFQVSVPAYRCDIMHECDLVEEVGIGYGYQQIAAQTQATARLAFTVGKPLHREELAELCRTVLTGLGFLETMSLALTSPQLHFTRLRLSSSSERPRLQNPVSSDQTELRAHLFSGLLQTLGSNSDARMPQHIFEIGDCFDIDEGSETGVKSTQKLAIAMAGANVSFASCRSVLEALSSELGLLIQMEPADSPLFIRGRGARILVSRVGHPEPALDWGTTGEIHPEVMESFGIRQPVALAEVSLDSLVT